MRQLHIVRHAGDALAREVIERQLQRGDEVRVVVTGDAAGSELPASAQTLSMPPLQYDALVDLLAWCERVVSW